MSSSRIKDHLLHRMHHVGACACFGREQVSLVPRLRQAFFKAQIAEKRSQPTEELLQTIALLSLMTARRYRNRLHARTSMHMLSQL